MEPVDNGVVRAYLDICALKRPFDDHSQPRIRLEANAVLELLAAPPERVTFVHSRAHDAENSHNPMPWRAGRVAAWLESATTPLDPTLLRVRVVDVVTLAREILS